MRRVVFSFLVIAAVLVAGCTGTGGGEIVSGGSGLEIIDFSIEPAEVRAGSSASFIVTAENRGEFKIPENDGLFKLILPSDWTIKSPSVDGEEKIDKNVMPADPSIERAADIISKRFRADAPGLSRGQTRTDQATVRAYYDFLTDSNGIVFLYPYGEDREDVSSFNSDNAPIRLDVRTSPSAPVIQDKGDYFTLIIDVTNVGSGKVFRGMGDGDYKNGAPTITAEDYNKVNITIDIMGEADEHAEEEKFANDDDTSWKYWLMDSDCAGLASIGDAKNTHEWELYGKTNPKTTIMCDVKVNQNVITTKTPVSLKVNATYGYYTETSGSITILGRN